MSSSGSRSTALDSPADRRIHELLARSPAEAAAWLEPLGAVEAAELLVQLDWAAVEIVWEMPPERRSAVVAAAPFGKGQQWLTDHSFGEGTVGRLMAKPLAVFRPETTVREAVETLRELVRRAVVTYGFVTEESGKLVGVLAFRELLFAEDDAPLASLMHRDPFFLRPEATLVDAMREVVTRHFPAYPVCDGEGRLVGMVRGQELFERQAFEISAQAGAMVGVEKEERLGTPWQRSLRFRHPWLQINLLTAFVAAAVVGAFQSTLDRLVVLAVFLPVLAGQSGNTGCQSLAVTLRGMTLGELRPGKIRTLLGKEAWLGLLNGILVGMVAASGMYFYSRSQGNAEALQLALVVLAAMTGACVASGLAGAAVPLTLKRLGADPATASSIFLTTATDVVSMGLFLGLATLFVG